MSFFERMKPVMYKLASMPLAIVILMVVALASVVGTVLLQNQEQADYLTQFGPVWYWVFRSLGLFDMYHAWWFIGLLGFLMLSLSLCLWRNVPKMLKEMQSRKITMADHAWKHLQQQGSLTLAASSDVKQIAEKVPSLLPAWAWQVQHDADGTVSMRGDKGRYHKWGYILVHSALLVILVGGWMSVQFGFRGNMSVPEGQKDSQITFLKGTDVASLDMPFEVRCNSFHLDFFGTGAPKEFRSNLTILEDGQEVLTSDIIVNEPLYYKGVRIYQASFGDGGSGIGLKLFRLDGSQVMDDAATSVYQTYTDPKTGVSLEIVDFKAFNVQNMAGAGEPKDFKDLGPAVDFILRGPGLKPVKVRTFMHPFEFNGQNQGTFMMISLTGDNRDYQSFFIGPDLTNEKEWSLFHAFAGNVGGGKGKQVYMEAFKQALGQVYGDERPQDMQDMGLRALQGMQMLSDFPWPFIPVLVDYEQVFYTGLQLAKDPGMDVVWVGSAILCIGLCMMLYVSHRRLWLVIRPEADGSMHMRVGGMTNRNPLSFTQAFNEDFMLLQQRLAPEQQATKKDGV